MSRFDAAELRAQRPFCDADYAAMVVPVAMYAEYADVLADPQDR